MKKPHHDNQLDVRTSKLSRRTRLQALLFTGTALGTAIVPFAAASPKIPPFVGE